MKKWLLNIPKILNTYWGGGHLTYIRFLTIKTFMKLNPDWEIRLYYPKKPFIGDPSWNFTLGMPKVNEHILKNYLPDLMSLPIIKKEMDFESLGFAPGIPEVHKADFMRINSMYQVGGVWTDMDILYFKPITELKVNISENKDKEIFVCIADYGHSTGFNMAKPNNLFFETLMGTFNEEYDRIKYQCWGPDLYNKYFKKIESIPNSINLDMDVVYAYDCFHVAELMNKKPQRFTDGSIGCHWYGGNPLWVKFLNDTLGGISNIPDSIIGRLLKNASEL